MSLPARDRQTDDLLNGSAGGAYDSGMGGLPEELDSFRAMTEVRLKEVRSIVRGAIPINVAKLPLCGTDGWPAASHCVVVNKSRLPQLFAIGWVFPKAVIKMHYKTICYL